jgi:hypothetical protein
VHCAVVTVAVDTSGFAVRLGQPASVTVEVSCRVRLADLALPGVPGRRILTGRAVSPLDPYRGRVLALQVADRRDLRPGGLA